jgi:NADPH:quinone reductase-like Zn-dependent oxidoreductase
MRAIVLEKFGGLDSLVYKEIPDPEPKPGHAVIEIKAFGINRPRCTCGGASGPRPRK